MSYKMVNISSSISSTSPVATGDSGEESILPPIVQEVLNEGIKDGFEEGFLGITSKNINDSMIPELCKWLAKLDGKVKTLSLSYNRITSPGASMLFEMLRTTNSSINELDLYNNSQLGFGQRISDSSINILAPYLEGNTTFRQLCLSRNEGITDKSIPILVKMIESSHIMDIDIRSTLITEPNAITVAVARNIIRYGYNTMDLQTKSITDNDIVKISEYMLDYNTNKLEQINLRNNEITSKGAALLFATLKQCNSIVSCLCFSSNLIDDECMKSLGEYVQDNKYLEVLVIGEYNYRVRYFNKITDKGVEILSDYLLGNNKLIELNLGGVESITDTSAPHLIDVVKGSCITVLNIEETSISYERHQEIQDALTIPIDQRAIPIKSNTKSAAKTSSFAST